MGRDRLDVCMCGWRVCTSGVVCACVHEERVASAFRGCERTSPRTPLARACATFDSCGKSVGVRSHQEGKGGGDHGVGLDGGIDRVVLQLLEGLRVHRGEEEIQAKAKGELLRPLQSTGQVEGSSLLRRFVVVELARQLAQTGTGEEHLWRQ